MPLIPRKNMADHTMDDAEQKFASNILIAIKAQEHELTSAQLIGTLRLLASALEAQYNGGQLMVQLVVEQEEDEDPSDDWKHGG